MLVGLDVSLENNVHVLYYHFDRQLCIQILGMQSVSALYRMKVAILLVVSRIQRSMVTPLWEKQ